MAPVLQEQLSSERQLRVLLIKRQGPISLWRSMTMGQWGKIALRGHLDRLWGCSRLTQEVAVLEAFVTARKSSPVAAGVADEPF